MHDLYSFSQVIKKCSFYSLFRDDIHLCYRRLASEQKLQCDLLWQEIEFLVPDLKNQREELAEFEAIENKDAFQKSRIIVIKRWLTELEQTKGGLE